MSKTATYGEMPKRLKDEYRRMLDLWESGRIFYHFKAFIKKYAKTGWVRYDLIKEPLCAVLALSRLGISNIHEFSSRAILKTCRQAR